MASGGFRLGAWDYLRWRHVSLYNVRCSIDKNEQNRVNNYPYITSNSTYCDVPNPSNPCHDRKDYNETTRLYTCIDGSHEENWRDCEGGGTGSDDGDNGCQEEDNYCDRDQNCDSPEVDCIDDTKFDEDDYDG
jgi:hypothetical protein